MTKNPPKTPQNPNQNKIPNKKTQLTKQKRPNLTRLVQAKIDVALLGLPIHMVTVWGQVH